MGLHAIQPIKQQSKSKQEWSKKKTKTRKEGPNSQNDTKGDQKETWTTDDSLEGEHKDKINVPSHFKKYTVAHKKILLQQPQRETTGKGTSYDAPKQSNFVNLAQPDEDPKLVKIAQDLSLEEEVKLIQTLRDYMDVFAWTYKDLKGVDPNICQHTIPIKLDAKPVQLKPYTHNENFAKKIKAKVDRLLEANFSYKIKHTK